MPQILAAVAECVRRIVAGAKEEEEEGAKDGSRLGGVVLFGGGEELGVDVIVGAVAVEEGFKDSDSTKTPAVDLLCFPAPTAAIGIAYEGDGARAGELFAQAVRRWRLEPPAEPLTIKLDAAGSLEGVDELPQDKWSGGAKAATRGHARVEFALPRVVKSSGGVEDIRASALECVATIEARMLNPALLFLPGAARVDDAEGRSWTEIEAFLRQDPDDSTGASDAGDPAPPGPALALEHLGADAKSVRLELALDVVCWWGGGGKGNDAAAVVGERCRSSIQRAIHAVRRAIGCSEAGSAAICHFELPGWPLGLSVAYPGAPGGLDDAAAGIRRGLHRALGLAMDRPLLRIGNAIAFQEQEQEAQRTKQERLRDVHVGCKKLPASVQGELALIDGSYEYYHYMQDKMDDKGWGCAYRSLQSIISWFKLQRYTTKPVPSHRQIQEILVRIGDKQPSFVGSKNWIGAIELGYILDEYLGIGCKILTVERGLDMPLKGRELVQHFRSEGTPIMIGGGVLAYTLLGVEYNAATGECAFLILDPHYTGGEVLRTIHSGGWCGWKLGEDAKGGTGGLVFEKAAFYNLLLPQRPKEI